MNRMSWKAVRDYGRETVELVTCLILIDTPCVLFMVLFMVHCMTEPQVWLPEGCSIYGSVLIELAGGY